VFLKAHEGRHTGHRSYFVAGGITDVFLAWLAGGCTETPEEVAAEVAGLPERQGRSSGVTVHQRR